MATAPPPFALHPTDAIQGIIDLTMREGVKLYQNATRSFYTDPADYFNCEAQESAKEEGEPKDKTTMSQMFNQQ